ncbi:MAG: hypothetical protein ACXWAT_02010 [Methylobacter sp.]
MTNEQIYEQFNAIPAPYRALCIDAAAVGCYLYQQGHEEAGRKLLRTAIITGCLELDLIPALLENLPDSLNALAMHVEIRALVKNISG